MGRGDTCLGPGRGRGTPVPRPDWVPPNPDQDRGYPPPLPPKKGPGTRDQGYPSPAPQERTWNQRPGVPSPPAPQERTWNQRPGVLPSPGKDLGPETNVIFLRVPFLPMLPFWRWQTSWNSFTEIDSFIILLEYKLPTWSLWFKVVSSLYLSHSGAALLVSRRNLRGLIQPTDRSPPGIVMCY